LKEGLAAYFENGNKAWAPFYKGLLAEIEAREHADESLVEIEAALALAVEIDEHWTNSFLHRVRGEILLRRDPANPAPAENAFQAAVSIAREQGARTFELQAALPLAKLLKTNNRLLDAYDALAPALEGFAPTPELPAIAEAQALLAELAQSDAVRADRRNRAIRAKYAQAVYITEGATTAATKAAFERVDLSDFAKLSETEHVTALYGHFLQAVVSASGIGAWQLHARLFGCQSARKIDPLSASKIDPPEVVHGG
jgi:hypothetical protein